GSNVLDLKPRDWGGILRQMAILAAVPRAPPHSTLRRRVHQRFALLFRTDRAFVCNTVIKSIAEMYVSYSSRSRSAKSPSWYFPASWARHACFWASAETLTSRFATSGVRYDPMGSSRRSRIFVRFMD